MNSFESRGVEIRSLAKALVYEFMLTSPQCQANCEGIKLAQMFRECGFDWGPYPKTTSSNQQHWVAAIVQELKSEGKIERISESGPWRLL